MLTIEVTIPPGRRPAFNIPDKYSPESTRGCIRLPRPGRKHGSRQRPAASSRGSKGNFERYRELQFFRHGWWRGQSPASPRTFWRACSTRTGQLGSSRRITAPLWLVACRAAKRVTYLGYAPLFAACIRPKSRRHATHLFSGNALAQRARIEWFRACNRRCSTPAIRHRPAFAVR